MLRRLKASLSSSNPLRLFWFRIKSLLACVYFRYPANKMIVLGITGTNGKTTTTNLTAKILEEAGHKVGMASTINFKIGRKEWQNATHKTTLGPFQLQSLLRRMVKEGCKYAVIETSSHALAQHRVDGVSYDVVCVTNVTPEHLDYHKSMKAYRQDKMKLFQQLMTHKRKTNVPKISIHNADDTENFEEFMKFEADQKIAYGFRVSEDSTIQGQIRAEDIQLQPEFTDLVLSTPKEKLKMRLHLPGEFNVENLMAAAAICYSQGVSLKTVKEAIKNINLIPGRMEPIQEGQDFQVFIDFAMTEDGYVKLLSTLRKTTAGKLWVVFGCCGDRDRKKRPKIGEICGKMADKVVICDDEPYTEDPKVIREMILQGLENTKMVKNEDFFEIPDRSEAIEYAISNAKPGDTIVIPGMGDTLGRTFANGIMPWNEREEVRKILRKTHSKDAVSI